MSVKDYISIPELRHLTIGQAAFVVEYTKDFNTGLAAERCGLDPSQGGRLIEQKDVKHAISLILQRRMAQSDITAEWLLYEMVDNHTLARQMGNLSASNKALELIGKMASVDAFAADKIELKVGEELAERLVRGRERARARNTGTVVEGEFEEFEEFEKEDTQETLTLPEISFL